MKNTDNRKEDRVRHLMEEEIADRERGMREAGESEDYQNFWMRNSTWLVIGMIVVIAIFFIIWLWN